MEYGQKNEGPGEHSPGPSMRSGSASAFLHHTTHTTHATHAVVMAAHARCLFLIFGHVGHGYLGGQHQPGDARGIL